MTYEASIRITNPSGLHARPAVKLAQLAAGFDANVLLRVGDSDWVKASSTAKVMKLKARAESLLHVRAEGAQAANAVAALVGFVKRNFDEQTSPVVTSSAGQFSVPVTSTENTTFNAEIACPGLAMGVLHWLVVQPLSRSRQKGSLSEEQAVFQTALKTTQQQLKALIEASDQADADILAFQIALLQDDEWVAKINESIANGIAAHHAWTQIMDQEISDYENTDDPLFRSRASDLRDLQQRLLRMLFGTAIALPALPDGAVIIADELMPSYFLELPWDRLGAAVVFKGSYSSHVAMLARARGVPMLIVHQTDRDKFVNVSRVLVDGEKGQLLINPDAPSIAQFSARMQQRKTSLKLFEQVLEKPARSSDGAILTAYINVDDPVLLKNVSAKHCDGIGLTRTEFLFNRNTGLPDEETQYRTYCDLLAWAQDRTVTIRTLDGGGDKPIAGLTPVAESNPFLGERGLRLSLNRTDIFTIQLRALARAAVHGRLKVLLPMVTLPSELAQARCLLQQQIEKLHKQKIAAAMPSLGMMVEVPAAALTIADFDADFFSIGSNDLLQYTLAAGRDCAAVAALQDPLHPALLELISRVALHGMRTDTEVSICGEMAAQPQCIPALLTAGISVFSVPPAQLGLLKSTLAETSVKVNI